MKHVVRSFAYIALAFGLAAQPVAAGGGAMVQGAQSLLERGEAEAAYYHVLSIIEAGAGDASNHVLAAQAALQHVKGAPLLRKKRWAKRGRDHYKAALAQQPGNVDALFGLATFALRAPSSLGGGEDALAQYSARLALASPAKSTWLSARARVDDNNIEEALSAYARAISFEADAKLVGEYAAFAVKQGAQRQAYAVLDAAQAQTNACGAYAMGTLARSAGEQAASALAHFDTLLGSQQRYCSRTFAALDAAAQAREIAAGLGLETRAAQYEDQIAAFKAQLRSAEQAADIAS